MWERTGGSDGRGDVRDGGGQRVPTGGRGKELFVGLAELRKWTYRV